MKKFLLLLVLLEGCGTALPELQESAPGKLEVYAEDSALIEATDYAITFWNSHCPLFQLSQSTNSTLSIAQVSQIAIGSEDDAGIAFVGTNAAGELVSCDIKVDGSHLDDFNRLVEDIAHEMGHCLGLSHQSENGLLMSKNADSLELTEQEIEVVCPK